MSTITAVKLSVVPTTSTEVADVTVSYEIVWTSADKLAIQELKVQYEVWCQVWGRDAGPNHILNPDDLLYTFSKPRKVSPTNIPNPTTGSFKEGFGFGKLNEDVGTDEIFARILLVDATDSKKRFVVHYRDAGDYQYKF